MGLKENREELMVGDDGMLTIYIKAPAIMTIAS